MFAAERQAGILARLERHGQVRVADLALELGVAEETVRRDLDQLVHDGLVCRTHGGAVPRPVPRPEEHRFAVRQQAELAAKTMIAVAASAELADGQVIAVDDSTSAYAFAQAIPNLALTVVTTSVAVVEALSGHDRINVVCTGGFYDPVSRSCHGAVTIASLERLNVGTLFFSCLGVDLERGLSESTDDLVAVKRCLMARAERLVLLADHTKFGVRSALTVAGIDELDLVVTDPETPAAAIDGLAARGVRALVAPATGPR
jgi:DeoR/GlpR family transcriptional regulator of sugar metabolism